MLIRGGTALRVFPLLRSEISSSPNEFLIRVAAIMRKDPCTGKLKQTGRKGRMKHIQRNSFWGNVEEFMCFILQSPLLFSLIHYKGHKLQLALWGLIYLW